MGWYILTHCSADIMQSCYVPSLLSEDHSYLVMNGDRITALRCSTAGRWKAFRIEGNKLGPPIDITNFKSADNSLTFTVDDATNTGYYYCLNKVDEAEIYDRYVILTNSECRKWTVCCMNLIANVL